MTAIQLIGDRDTVLAFALGGVVGHVADTGDAAATAVARIVRDTRTRGGMLQQPTILLITQQVAELIRPQLDEILLEPAAPVILEIPGFAEPSDAPGPLAHYLRRVLGVSL